MPEALVIDALTAARDLKEFSHQSIAMARVSDRLKDNHRTSVLADALIAARKSKDPSLVRVSGFVEVAKRLSEPERSGVFREALVQAKSIFWTPGGIAELAACAEFLSDEFVSELLVVSVAIRDYEAQGIALANVAALLSNPHKACVFQEAIAVARRSEGMRRVKALCTIGEKLPEDERGAVIKEASEAVELVDAETFVEFLPEIATLLPESDRSAFINKRMQRLELVTGYKKAFALNGIAAALPRSERSLTLKDAIGAAMALDEPVYRCSILCSLAELVSEKSENEKSNLLDAALVSARATKKAELEGAVIANRCRLLKESGSQLTQALTLVCEAETDEIRRMSALGSIVHATPEADRLALIPIAMSKLHVEAWRAHFIY